MRTVVSNAFRHHCMFKKLLTGKTCILGTFQTPFGITACLRSQTVIGIDVAPPVSNAFRHHCMFKASEDSITEAIRTFQTPFGITACLRSRSKR